MEEPRLETQLKTQSNERDTGYLRWPHRRERSVDQIPLTCPKGMYEVGDRMTRSSSLYSLRVIYTTPVLNRLEKSNTFF